MGEEVASIRHIVIVPFDIGYVVSVKFEEGDEGVSFAFNTFNEVLAFLETNLD